MSGELTVTSPGATGMTPVTLPPDASATQVMGADGVVTPSVAGEASNPSVSNNWKSFSGAASPSDTYSVSGQSPEAADTILRKATEDTAGEAASDPFTNPNAPVDPNTITTTTEVKIPDTPAADGALPGSVMRRTPSNEVSKSLNSLATGLATVGDRRLGALTNLTAQSAALAGVAEAILDGRSAADAVKAVGTTFGQGEIVVPAVNAVQLLTGEKSLSNTNDVLNTVRDLGASVGGRDGTNLAQTADVALAANRMVGLDLASGAGIQAGLNTGSAIAALFDDPKLAAGANVASQAVNVFSGGANVGSVTNLAASALGLAGVDPKITNTVGTIAGLVTNPVGTVIGFALSGLNDALTWRPNESKLADVYGAVRGTNNSVNVMRVGETDAQDGRFGIKISQLNSATITEKDLGPSVLREGQFITNGRGDARATLTDTGLLQLQKKQGNEWKTEFQAGIAVNAKSETVLYVDQNDGRSKIALAGKAADGSAVYTPIWQSDRAAGPSGAAVQAKPIFGIGTGEVPAKALNVGDNGMLQVGNSVKTNIVEYSRNYDPGFMGWGGAYNRAENGQAIAQAGTTEFATKGDYGNFNNKEQAPKLQTVNATLGLYDVQFKSEKGNDIELVREQRNAADLAKSSSLSFFEVQAKDAPVAEWFSSAKVLSTDEAIAGIRAGKFEDVTKVMNAPKSEYQQIVDRSKNKSGEIPSVVSGIDGKSYRVYADRSNSGEILKVESTTSLEKQAYAYVDVSKLETRFVVSYPWSRGPRIQDQKLTALEKDLKAGNLREISAYVTGPLVSYVGGTRGGSPGQAISTRVFQEANGNIFKIKV